MTHTRVFEIIKKGVAKCDKINLLALLFVDWWLNMQNLIFLFIIHVQLTHAICAIIRHEIQIIFHGEPL